MINFPKNVWPDVAIVFVMLFTMEIIKTSLPIQKIFVKTLAELLVVIVGWIVLNMISYRSLQVFIGLGFAILVCEISNILFHRKGR